MTRERFTLRPASAEELLRNDPLRDYFVMWLHISSGEVDAFEHHLNAAPNEAAMQSYFESRPLLLIQHLGGGHGRYVIPHKRLGSEHVTDFMIAEEDSGGTHWTAVELESPRARMFTKAGKQSAALTQAIRQILDWRAWLKKNQNYAARLRTDQGLGLKDIDPDVRGLILIGRDTSIDPATNGLRQELVGNLRIEIHSYDWLVRSARGHVQALGRS
jgi:hypothetical protein